jgi:hypothetical protein
LYANWGGTAEAQAFVPGQAICLFGDESFFTFPDIAESLSKKEKMSDE